MGGNFVGVLGSGSTRDSMGDRGTIGILVDYEERFERLLCEH